METKRMPADTLRFPPRRRNAWRAAMLATMLATAGNALAGINAPVRVVFDGNLQEMSLALDNPGQQPSLVQAWIDDGNPDTAPSDVQSPFLTTQPHVRLDPGARHSLRILYTPAAIPLPEDRESRFFLNLLDVPPKIESTQEEGVLSLAVRYRMPLVYRPAALTQVPNPAFATAALMPWALSLKEGAWELQAQNQGRYYLTVGNIRLSQDGIEYAAESNEIAPYTTQEFVLTATTPQALAHTLDKSRPMRLTYTVIDDYGRPLPVNRQME
jgi:chaperone protein EcpD